MTAMTGIDHDGAKMGDVGVMFGPRATGKPHREEDQRQALERPRRKKTVAVVEVADSG